MSDLGPHRADEPAPLLVRIAGLPTETMESFHSDLCANLAREELSLRDRLGSARAEMADRTFALIHHSSPDLRRVLLEIKRDCFNGRPLLRHRGSPHWPAFDALIGTLTDRVVELEEALERLKEDYRSAYERAVAREREALGSLYTAPSLLRGVTLASPALVENLPRLSRGLGDKRQARLEASLLRYASRAALKTSPFSTLTRIGFGVVVPGPVGPEPCHPGVIRLVGTPWHERSLVRYKRYILDQDYARLSQHPPFRDRLRVALNSSLWESAPGRYCFIRPAF
jgi:hypothetical protein